jgi:Prokaryotic E2 family E
MRREFALLEMDRDYLDATGTAWEAVRNGGDFWLLLHNVPLPAGYTVGSASVAIKIEPGYPNAQLDMAYFSPPLARADGKPIPCAEVMVQIDGRQWQRWSRHRTAANPWLAGEDSLETHLILVRDWLAREFQRR